MSEVICPRCKSKETQLVDVATSVRQRFGLLGEGGQLPPQLCRKCAGEIEALLGSFGDEKDPTKADSTQLRLWKNRVELVKRARVFMKNKKYGKAVANYEKYLRVLGLFLKVSEDRLAPQLFKERLDTKELTLISSVYWDLLRVYDTNSKYMKRMESTAEKLIQFAPLTPIALDIAKQAEAHRKKAMNPNVFKGLARKLLRKRNRCFIATAAFEDPRDWSEVDVLRQFRDEVLLSKRCGVLFVNAYYRISPTIADVMDRFPISKGPVRWGLKALIYFLRRAEANESKSEARLLS